MAVRIEAISISKNPVATKESFIISVTIVTQGYLKRSKHSELSGYTNGQLHLRGGSVPTYAYVSKYRHSKLHEMTHQQIETMEVENGS